MGKPYRILVSQRAVHQNVFQILWAAREHKAWHVQSTLLKRLWPTQDHLGSSKARTKTNFSIARLSPCAAVPAICHGVWHSTADRKTDKRWWCLVRQTWVCILASLLLFCGGSLTFLNLFFFFSIWEQREWSLWAVICAMETSRSPKVLYWDAVITMSFLRLWLREHLFCKMCSTVFCD